MKKSPRMEATVQAKVETKSMNTDTVPDVTGELASALYAWRTRVLNGLLTTTVIVALLPMGVATVQAFRDPGQRPAMLAFLVLYLFLAGLAVLRRLDTHLRAWGFLLAGQAVAMLATARGGLAGDGRVYFMALPVLALIIIGGRSALLMSVISMVAHIVFAILAQQGQLEKWLIIPDNPVAMEHWISTGVSMMMALALVMVLLEYFHRFQMRTMEAERQASMELAQTRDLLEEYNQTLEHKVQQRTAELQESIERREQLQQQIIAAQQLAIQELSTPIIPIMDRIIVMPLIGMVDSQRTKDTMRALLAGISQHRAKVVILDITGVPVVDSGVAAHLDKTIQAARLKGARTIITGISDAVAESIVDLGIDWSEIETLADLQTGLLAALGSMEIKGMR